MAWNFRDLSPQLQRRIVADGAPLPNKIGQPAQPVKLKGVQNASEKDFYVSYLSPLQLAGRFSSVDYEGTTLPLAHRCNYTPDFDVRDGTGNQSFYEVKAPHRFRTAGVYKLKFAAQTYKEFEFYLCEKKKGQWKVSRVPYDRSIKAKSFVSPEPQEDE